MKTSKKDFDISVKFKNTRSPDKRHNVTVDLNGLNYDGLVHYKGNKMHIYIPEIDKTFIMDDNH